MDPGPGDAPGLLAVAGAVHPARGVYRLLHRIGWTPRVPRHVAAERDEEEVATWARETWPNIKGPPPG